MSSIRGLQTGQQSRLVPTTGTNAPQCATCWSPEHWSRLLPLTGTIARHEPGPLPFPDEPGPLPGIGPGSEMNREQCLDERGVCLLVRCLSSVSHERSLESPSKIFFNYVQFKDTRLKMV